MVTGAEVRFKPKFKSGLAAVLKNASSALPVRKFLNPACHFPATSGEGSESCAKPASDCGSNLSSRNELHLHQTCLHLHTLGAVVNGFDGVGVEGVRCERRARDFGKSEEDLQQLDGCE